MRSVKRTLLFGASSLLLLWSLPPSSAAAQPFEVFFHPPGVLLRSEPAGLLVFAGTPPPGLSPVGDA